MPPPNITGKLHMGHALDLSLIHILTSDMSKKLTVNGLKDGAKVEVSSDNENAVTAAYADGEVTLRCV